MPEELWFRFHPELHHLNLLFEDTATGTRWSQLARAGIEGELAGVRLRTVPSVQTTWAHWRREHPDTLVLRPDWGWIEFAYRPGTAGDGPRSGTDLALTVQEGADTRVYAFADLARQRGAVDDRLAGRQVVIRYDPEGPTAWAASPDGAPLAASVMYWSFLNSFYPGASIWSGPDR